MDGITIKGHEFFLTTERKMSYQIHYAYLQKLSQYCPPYHVKKFFSQNDVLQEIVIAFHHPILSYSADCCSSYGIALDSASSVHSHLKF